METQNQKKRRHFPTIVKLKLIEEVNQSSLQAVSIKHQIDSKLINKWRKQFARKLAGQSATAQTVPARPRVDTPVAYVAHLERMLAEKSIELERLKYKLSTKDA